jgi:hypothetical protein
MSLTSISSNGISDYKKSKTFLRDIPSPGVLAPPQSRYILITEVFNANGTFYPKLDDRVLLNLEVLVVSGGGGGGTSTFRGWGDWECGGGGAGGLIYNNNLQITSRSPINVTVGRPGGPGPRGGDGVNIGIQGGNSSFGSHISCIGGGGGAGYGSPGTQGNGGSGGGGGRYGGGGTGTSGQGNNGAGNTTGGGGGGKNSAGSGNTGGTGYTSSISGTSVVYAGGGNGNVGSPSVKAVSTGYGGDGAQSTAYRRGGSGSSGIVIVRYYI